MYRPRTRRGDATNDNKIKGPNSALSEFLREQGINAENIRQRWLKKQKQDELLEKEGNENENEVTKNVYEQKLAQEDKELREVISIADDYSEEENTNLLDKSNKTSKRNNITTSARRLRSFKLNEDENELLEIKELTTDSNRRRTLRSVAEQDSDEEEYTPSSKEVVLIDQSNKPSKVKNQKKTIQERRKRRKRAADLLNRRVNKIPSLQELVIMKISEQITSIESKKETGIDKPIFSQLRDILGGVSLENFNNLAKTLCKNRSLNDDTLQLFLQTKLETLEFHDCSKISYEGYKTLAVFTPRLKYLSLQMCGQLNNEALIYLADKLQNLECLYLDGPFLINEETWDIFFSKMKSRLKHFKISNTHRFTNNSLKSLMSNCGIFLKTLGLSRLDSINEYNLIPLHISENTLEHLILEYPYKEEDLNDQCLIDILNKSPHLETLRLNGCTGLTDSFIINGIGESLNGQNGNNNYLKVIELEDLDQISSDGIIYLFSRIQFTTLEICNLKKCVDLDDSSIQELFSNKATESLKYLNLNSLHKITRGAFEGMNFPVLERFNCSFVRSVDDSIIKLIETNCPKLTVLEVFGNNKISSKAMVRKGLALIGRQSDIL
ncbi:related to DNA repair protein RAD7 [Saccharomycodes ludwigii]|uniref:Related to DNA repair protein RAD7 n=1 Tax=Saccharomycodes ludwigii TaxID=36035 RepID=A0A376B797_9ASCO|nr:hypothetical protein SCDLUD_000445 [Saccharomycodes ludwigii]KAH3902852.1 hypothetical protein SCDLUD_000445 [Saccharomycodes ludwigii]SSD60354.1 related to DNA repair protein RAD7 [Saccharomycodes ludwigii]